MSSYLESENKYDCSGCQACKNICPKDCISMEYDNEGFLYPVIDKLKCVNCQKCINVCEYNKEISEVSNQKVYAARNKDENIVKKSSSGGLFIPLSDYILEENGMICGAKFNEEYLVTHDITNNKEIRDSFCGSKYLQSNVGDIYKEVEKNLKVGRKVLFTGTPCQVDGLKNYLNKEYDNLVLMDFVCHGVPSPILFKKHIDKKSKKYKDNISNLTFRYKKAEWGTQNLKINFNNGKIYSKKGMRDTYYNLFLSNIILRPSCYKCRYSNTNRVSDITIADFWGIEDIKPKFHSKNGASLLIINTKKGEILINDIKDEITLEESSFEEAKKRQVNLSNPSTENKRRKLYFKIYDKLGFSIANFFVIHFIKVIKKPVNVLRKIKYNN